MPHRSMVRLTLRGVCLMTIAAAVALGQQPETPPAPGTPKDFRLPPKTTFTDQMSVPAGSRLSPSRT